MPRVHAEIGLLPIDTSSTSLSKYIATTISALDKIDWIRYEVIPMGTIIEPDNLDKILVASKAAMNAVFEAGVTRIETILKIDEHRDKDQ